MNLKETIETDLHQAMLEENKITRDLLRVVKAEIQRAEAGIKTLENADVVKLMRGMVENLKTVATESATKEIEILESYLPKMMSLSEIELHVENLLKTGEQTLGSVMKYFNLHHKGVVDNKLVSQITNEKLSQQTH